MTDRKFQKSKNELFAAFHVDAQKGFTPLCPDELPIPHGDTIVGELNYLTRKCDVLIGSKDAHPYNAVWIATDEQPMGTPLNYNNADQTWNRHCVVGSKGFELLDGLPHPLEYDYFVWKGQEVDVHPYGACYHDLSDTVSTGVIEYLKSKNIDNVILGGLALDYCVGTTANQLLNNGFNVFIYMPSTHGIAEDSCDKMVDTLKTYGVRFIQNRTELDSLVR